MAKFHINPATGSPGSCSAQVGNCPFGSDSEHFSTAADARTAYEASMQSFTPGQVKAKQADEARSRALTIQGEIRAIFQNDHDDFEDDSPSHEHHGAIASTYREFAEASDACASHATSAEERSAWQRTAALARVREAEHLGAAHILTPRAERGDRKERSAKSLALHEATRKATEAYEELEEDYDHSPAVKVETAIDISNFTGKSYDEARADFFTLSKDEQNARANEASAAINAVLMHRGNVELAADEVYVGVSDDKIPYSSLDAGRQKHYRFLAQAALDRLRR